MDDFCRITALDVADGDEVRHQRAVHVLDREVALMILQRGDEHLARQRQEALFEAAGNGHRPFHQGGHLVQQRVPDQRFAAASGRRRCYATADRLASRLEARNHVAPVTQCPLVARRRWDAHRLGCMKAVPVCQVRGDRIQHCRRDYFVPVEHEQPVHRAHELGTAGSPVHAARDRQRVQGTLNDAGQQVLHVRARFGADEKQKLAFAFVELLQLLDRRAAALRERQRGASGLPGRVERGGYGWSAAFDVLVGLPRSELLHHHREASRCGKRNDLPWLQAHTFQSGADARCEPQLQGAKGLGRQLFGPDLNQEVVTSGARGARGRRRGCLRYRVCAHAGAPATPAVGLPPWLASIGKPRASRLA